MLLLFVGSCFGMELSFVLVSINVGGNASFNDAGRTMSIKRNQIAHAKITIIETIQFQGVLN